MSVSDDRGEGFYGSNGWVSGKRCSETMFRDYHRTQCSRRGTIERNGKLYCKQHDPEAAQARRAANDAKWKAESAKRSAGYDIEKLRGEVTEIARKVFRQEATIVHFISFRGEEYWSAVKVWGKPHYIHMGWDMRAQREIDEGDLIIFAQGSEADQPKIHNYPDTKERA